MKTNWLGVIGTKDEIEFIKNQIFDKEWIETHGDVTIRSTPIEGNQKFFQFTADEKAINRISMRISSMQASFPREKINVIQIDENGKI